MTEPSRNTRLAIRGAVIFVPFAYVVYSAVTGSGLVGWLHYAQQAVFGSYYEKLSFILAAGASFLLSGLLLYLGTLAWPGYFGLKGIAPGPLAGVPLGAKPAQKSSAQPARVLLVPAILIPLVWLGGYAVYAWIAHQRAEDALAQYQAIDLRVPGPFRPAGSHLALRGGTVPPDLVLAQIRDPGKAWQKVEYRLAPIVQRDWKPGEAVSFVLKAEDPADLADLLPPEPSGAQHGAPPPRRPEDSLVFARVGGSVSPAAAAEFRKSGASLADRVYVLERVPAENGLPVDRSTDIRDYFLACGLVSVILFALALATWIMLRFRR
jgi:hypothetical protein